MAALFDCSVANVNRHLKAVFESGELHAGSVIKNFLKTIPSGMQTTDVRHMCGEAKSPTCANVDHCGLGLQHVGFGETDVLRHAGTGHRVFPDNARFVDARL